MREGVRETNGCIGAVEQEKLQKIRTRCSAVNTQQPFLDEWFSFCPSNEARLVKVFVQWITAPQLNQLGSALVPQIIVLFVDALGPKDNIIQYFKDSRRRQC
jgi:hypothetical protein